MKTTNSRREIRRLLWILALCGALLAGLWFDNSAVGVTDYTVESDRLPASFDGCRIAQVSDLHNTSFGADNAALLQKIEAATPDWILLTGDLIDANRTDIPLAVSFAEQAVQIAPVYYVPGNHESIPQYAALREGLLQAGVTVLEDEAVTLARGGDTLTLLGVRDPAFWPGQSAGGAIAAVLSALVPDPDDGFTVLLSHRPELFDVYVDAGVDLVFSGHAHGGQFRLPLLGGLYAPHQGLFPQYDAGLFPEGRTQMVVSRGLGNSSFPVRLFNRPELVVVTLRAAS